MKNEKRKSGKYEKTILLEVDEATKGIMQEIQTGITDDIIDKIKDQIRLLEEIQYKIDETYNLECKNNVLLNKLLRKTENLEERV